jgi:sec-independent protein translocase protein TatA
MFGLGIGELLVILVIVLVIFGAGKLPELGQGLGRGIRSFRKELQKPDEIDVTPKADDAPEREPRDGGSSQSGSSQT